jgi:hypothetical protein
MLNMIVWIGNQCNFGNSGKNSHSSDRPFTPTCNLNPEQRAGVAAPAECGSGNSTRLACEGEGKWASASAQQHLRTSLARSAEQ